MQRKMNDQTMHTLAGPAQFPTTRCTLVVAAANPERKAARCALVSLCENYWYPLFEKPELARKLVHRCYFKSR